MRRKISAKENDLVSKITIRQVILVIGNSVDYTVNDEMLRNLYKNE